MICNREIIVNNCLFVSNDDYHDMFVFTSSLQHDIDVRARLRQNGKWYFRQQDRSFEWMSLNRSKSAQSSHSIGSGPQKLNSKQLIYLGGFALGKQL